MKNKCCNTKCCEMCHQHFKSGLVHCTGIATCLCHQSTKEENKEICKLCKDGGFTLPPPCPHQSNNTEDQVDSKRNRKYFPDLDLTNTGVKCPLRVHPYGLNDPIPLCFYERCTHILLPGEKKCPCHIPKQVSKEESWEEEFDKCIHGSVADRQMNGLYIYPGEMIIAVGKVKSFIQEQITKEFQKGVDFGKYLGKKEAVKEVVEEIRKHNVRILNQFQLQGKPDMPFIAYDERVCLIPAMEIATEETINSLNKK